MGRTTSYQEQHFCSVSGSTDYFKLDTWRVLASQFNFKKRLLSSITVSCTHFLAEHEHSLHSNRTVSNSLSTKSMLVGMARLETLKNSTD